MKTCTKCRDAQPLESFAKQAKGRFGVTSICRNCSSERGKKWHKANREKSIATKAAYNSANKDAHRTYAKAWRQKNSGRLAVLSAAWSAANPGKKNASAARRRAAKLRATPDWANHEMIEKFYVLAASLFAMTGVKANVDHIVPLQSKIVCGLHHSGNLTITTERQNKSKGNLRWPDMP